MKPITVATRCPHLQDLVHPVLQRLYRRRVAQGKRKMVTVVACTRKLLVTLNTMIKNNQSRNPKTT